MSNGSFSAGLRSWPELVAKRHRDTKRGTAIKLFTAVIKDSPVDTGRLRSNWQTSLDRPDYSSSDVSTTEGAAIAEMTGKVLSLDGKEDLFMVNSLPYVYRIEHEGWSHTKAPLGMVYKNALRFRELLKKQLNQLKRQGGAL